MGGRPAYEPTPEDRRLVSVMAAHGINHTVIGKALSTPCSDVTLRKHFAPELASARSVYKGKVAAALHMHLMGRPAQFTPARFDAKGKLTHEPKLISEEIRPNPTIAIFQAKVVLGQKETQRTEV